MSGRPSPFRSSARTYAAACHNGARATAPEAKAHRLNTSERGKRRVIGRFSLQEPMRIRNLSPWRPRRGTPACTAGPAARYSLLAGPVIVHFNQSLDSARTGSEGSRETFAELAGRVAASLATLLEQGQVDRRTLSTLRIHLDWIQYRANFRDPVIVRRAIDAQGRSLPLAELAIDLRQVEPDRLTSLLADAHRVLRGRAVEPDHRPLLLDEFCPLRDSLIWR